MEIGIIDIKMLRDASQERISKAGGELKATQVHTPLMKDEGFFCMEAFLMVDKIVELKEARKKTLIKWQIEVCAIQLAVSVFITRQCLIFYVGFPSPVNLNHFFYLEVVFGVVP